MVGSIIQTYKENNMVEKGAEKGRPATGDASGGAPLLLLAVSSYSERSCHVHCAHLDLGGMTVRAAPVPCLVGTARPHAVAIARGGAAPRLKSRHPRI